jgi:gas vesicle protein
MIELVIGVLIGAVFTAGTYELFLRPKVKITEEYYKKVREAYDRLNKLAEQVEKWPDSKEDKKGGE